MSHKELQEAFTNPDRMSNAPSSWRIFFMPRISQGACCGIFKSSHIFSDTISVLKSVDKVKPDRQNERLRLVCCQSPEELQRCQSTESRWCFLGTAVTSGLFSACLSVCVGYTWLPPKPVGSSSKAAERWLIMTGGGWSPLCFVPLTSYGLCSAFLGIIILIECRWCRVGFFSAPAELREGGDLAGGAGTAGDTEEISLIKHI